MRTKLATIVFILFSATAQAQLSYDVYVTAGRSSFKEVDNEPYITMGNTYAAKMSYALGTDISYRINGSSFVAVTGLMFSSVSAENSSNISPNTPGFVGKEAWRETRYSIGVPVKAAFLFEEWCTLSAGVMNNFYLNKPDEMWDKELKTYTLGLVGGVDFLVKQKYIIGFQYQRDLDLMAKAKNVTTGESYKIGYYVQQFSVKLGYRFARKVPKEVS